jgi:hypothetical protein
MIARVQFEKNSFVSRKLILTLTLKVLHRESTVMRQSPAGKDVNTEAEESTLLGAVT